MIEKVVKQLEIVNKSIRWVKETETMKGAKGDAAYRNFTSIRRLLKKKYFSIKSNPAAAIFGQSQVGKSYLINSLLSSQSTPFKIYDAENNQYEFKKDVNPPGGGSESTSLVSRFSASYQPINSKFPIKANLLSIADLILVLCDSYYNDIHASRESMLEISQIEDHINALKIKYQDKTDVQFHLSEDDVMDIREYVYTNFSTKASNLPLVFFDALSAIVSKVKSDEWKDLFSVLWNNNEKFTSLFSRLIKEFEKIKFTDTLFLPVESVLYTNGTLLDIIRIKELYEEPRKLELNFKATTDLLLVDNNEEIIINSYSKSCLCALTAELVFSIPSEISEIKPFLKNIDLLDFPGARARKTTPENDIVEKSMADYLIRGKVAYLFNKYSNYEKLNILLMCAKHEQPTERAMPELLAPLIKKIIGETPEAREDFIANSKVSPLFIIGTFFNINLEYYPSKDNNVDNTSLLYRWDQRFDRSLAEELIDIKTYDWFTNWTTSQKYFNNIFLLRDFEYSTQIYDGYTRKTPTEKIKRPDPEVYSNFYQELRKSFIEYPFVKRHFSDPEESWDRAASINEDGTGLIIDKLNLVSGNIAKARKHKMVIELNHLSGDLENELRKYFHDTDSDKILEKAKSTAGRLQANLDIAFGRDPYFFGTMMKEFMLPQSAVFNLYHNKINEIGRKDNINMDKYSGIRVNVSSLHPSNTYDENLHLLKVKYEYATNKECEEYFSNEGIDLNELFYGNNDRVKHFSGFLAESLEKFWFEDHMLQNKSNLEKFFSSEGLIDIQEMLRSLFSKLKVKDLIEESIKRHVNGYRNIDDVYEMIADISSEIINKFINSVGSVYFNESDLTDLKVANEQNSLGLILDHEGLNYGDKDRNEVARLITQMDNLADLLNQNPLPVEAKKLPNYRNYIVWYDLLKVGFVSVCNIPNYDVEANKNLELIILESKTVNY